MKIFNRIGFKGKLFRLNYEISIVSNMVKVIFQNPENEVLIGRIAKTQIDSFENDLVELLNKYGLAE